MKCRFFLPINSRSCDSPLIKYGIKRSFGSCAVALICRLSMFLSIIEQTRVAMSAERASWSWTSPATGSEACCTTASETDSDGRSTMCASDSGSGAIFSGEDFRRQSLGVVSFVERDWRRIRCRCRSKSSAATPSWLLFFGSSSGSCSYSWNSA